MSREIKLNLPGVEDLFSTQETRDDAKLERIKDIPLEELHPFQNHPFKVRQDAELEKLTESIRTVGAISPALARPRPDDGYELISGAPPPGRLPGTGA